MTGMPDITQQQFNQEDTSSSLSHSDPEVKELEKHKTLDLLKMFVGDIIRYVFPLAVSVCLILWLVHKVDFKDVMHIIHEKCNFLWIAIMMLMTMLSMAIRGFRWNIQLTSAGIKSMPPVSRCVSIWGAYALDLLFPNMGEAWRCIYASKRQKAPLSTVIGTDIGDRLSDLAMILMLSGLSLIVAHPFIMDFLKKYKFGQDVYQVVDNPYLWISIGGVIAFLWAVIHFFKTKKWVMKLTTNLKRMWLGFKVIFTMKLWWLYLILTVAIWTCYFSKVYLCFFSFDYTDALIHEPGTAYGFIPGLVVFVFSSISIAIPSNGGLGPWNLAVMFSLSLFGIPNAEGAAFSLVVWTFETIMIVVLGFFSLGYILYTNKKISKSKDSNSEKPNQDAVSTSPSQINS
ncbi:MAG: flippase-like domain-containing protein [Muribaculaceae bacterium]|nr:flippase-like domain-containing protein [Muribaculaceae bacterium]